MDAGDMIPEVVQLYEEMIRNGKASPDVYINLAHIYWQAASDQEFAAWHGLPAEFVERAFEKDFQVFLRVAGITNQDTPAAFCDKGLALLERWPLADTLREKLAEFATTTDFASSSGRSWKAFAAEKKTRFVNATKGARSWIEVQKRE